MEYCDYIADVIFHAIVDDLNHIPHTYIKDVDKVKRDLHPTEGWLVSTNKTMTVTDKNGRKYKVTVEAVEE